MRNLTDLSKLKIIAYADVLDPEMTPRTVPPVFQDKDNKDTCLVPPFEIHGDVVQDGTLCTLDELKDMAANDHITFLQEPIAAEPDHMLWIDEKMSPHYELNTQANNHLHQAAINFVQAATQALQMYQLNDADRLASHAVSANETYIDAWAIKAAIQHHCRNEDAAAVLTEVAAAHCAQGSFKLLTQYYKSMIPPGSQAVARQAMSTLDGSSSRKRAKNFDLSIQIIKPRSKPHANNGIKRTITSLYSDR